MFSKEERQKILQIARKSLESAFSGKGIDIPSSDLKQGAFVTLRKSNALRGCIGYLTGIKPLYEEIATLVREAAFNDYRFPPLKKEELPLITIEVSILSTPARIEKIEEFILERDGIILSVGHKRAVFLPQVAEETGWNKEQLLSALSEKAGLPVNAWKSPEAQFMTFQAEVFSEDDL